MVDNLIAFAMVEKIDKVVKSVHMYMYSVYIYIAIHQNEKAMFYFCQVFLVVLIEPFFRGVYN